MQISAFAHDRNLSAVHIPGKYNVIADNLSRIKYEECEWYLKAKTFDKVCKIFGVPEIDLCGL